MYWKQKKKKKNIPKNEKKNQIKLKFDEFPKNINLQSLMVKRKLLIIIL